LTFVKHLIYNIKQLTKFRKEKPRPMFRGTAGLFKRRLHPCGRNCSMDCSEAEGD
jgi:hypothetical protein